MSFPTKAVREKCWGAKDEYWQCLDKNEENIALCTSLRKLYEESCSLQWVKHFDRRRQYEKFKEKMEKGQWQDPLNEKQ